MVLSEINVARGLEGSVARKQPRLMPKDFEVMLNWVKYKLFPKVKFIPNPEKNLAVDQSVYKQFETECKKDIAGVKKLSAESGCLYMEMLWQEANKPKRKLVLKCMSTCRTTIYSAQANRFMCELLILVIV